MHFPNSTFSEKNTKVVDNAYKKEYIFSGLNPLKGEF